MEYSDSEKVMIRRMALGAQGLLLSLSFCPMDLIQDIVQQASGPQEAIEDSYGGFLGLG